MSRETATVASLACDQATATRLADLIIEMFDPDDVAVSTFEDTDGQWSFSALFRRPPDPSNLRALVADVIGPDGAHALSFSQLAPKDWVAASLEGLRPVEAGRFVVYGAHDRARIGTNRIAIEIEAGLAFGTGHHGTTRGCLLALDRLIKAARPLRMLDVGTGTGVLAIAAAKALRHRVIAGDIDHRAIQVARENAVLNGVAPLIRAVHAAGVAAGAVREAAPYDLVFANILLAPLKRLAPPLARVVRPGGTIVLSGLLRAHGNVALAAYRGQGLMLIRRIELEGWVTLILRRPTRA